MNTKQPATCRINGKKTDKILEIVDGSGSILAYECAACGRNGDTFHQILGHLNSHLERPKRVKTPPSRVEKFFIEHERLKAQNERLTARLKNERTARLRAERRLAQIDRLFAPVN